MSLSITTTATSTRAAKEQKVKIGRATNLHVHHAFVYISLPSMHDHDVKVPNRDFKTMFTRYRIAFAPPRNSCRIGLLFALKNVCSGAISVTERRCTAPISKAETHISDTHSYFIRWLFVAPQKPSGIV